MKCPNCKLENPKEAIECDCGHNFLSVSSEKTGIKAGRNVGRNIIGLILTVIAFFVNIVLLMNIVSGDNIDNVKSQLLKNKEEFNYDMTLFSFHIC